VPEVTLSAEQSEGLRGIIRDSGAHAVRITSKQHQKAEELKVRTYAHGRGWDTKDWKLRPSGAYSGPPPQEIWRMP
jgi:hypothetical protein